MSANKLFLIQNPPTVLNNLIPSAGENTSLYTQRGQYYSILKYSDNKNENVGLGNLYSDEFRISTMNFVDQAFLKTLCSERVLLGNYLNGEYTIDNIISIIKELKSKNSTLKFPRLNIR
jgi:hypothetical protein